MKKTNKEWLHATKPLNVSTADMKLSLGKAINGTQRNHGRKEYQLRQDKQYANVATSERSLG
jgi:hypothetical protein